MKSLVYILIAFLLATNNVFINFRVGFLSYDRLLEFIIFVIFIKPFINEFNTNSYFKKYTLFIILFAITQLLMNIKLVAFNNVESDVILKGFFKSFSFLVFSYLFLLIVKKDIKYLNLIIYLHLGICLFAILQHPTSPLSSEIHNIKMMLFKSAENNASLLKNLAGQEEYINLGMGNRFRLSGPFYSTITFSYFLFSTFILNLYMLIRTHMRFYILSLGFIILCSLLTQTRSLVLAQGFIIFFVYFFIHNSKLNSYKIAFTAIGLIFSIIFINKIENTLTQKDASRLTNKSAKGDQRPLLWLTGIYAVTKHPFGVSKMQYDTIKKEMSLRYGMSGLQYLPSHNGFINVGFNYSFLGYFIIIGFFIFLYGYTNSFSKDFKYLFILFFLGYTIHSSFHNDYFFSSDYDVLMILMLLPLHLIYELENKQLNLHGSGN
jgi:O-Antigen ligase